MKNAKEGFSRLWPTAFVVVGYIVSFTSLGFALKEGLPLSVGYAIWSGVGTAAVAVAGVMFFQERMSLTGFLGMGCIIVGVILLHLGPASNAA